MRYDFTIIKDANGVDVRVTPYGSVKYLLYGVLRHIGVVSADRVLLGRVYQYIEKMRGWI